MKVDVKHWEKVWDILKPIIRSNCYDAYKEFLNHYGTYVVYRDKKMETTQVIHALDYSDYKIMPLPPYWFDRLALLIDHVMEDLSPRLCSYSDQKYIEELSLKTKAMQENEFSSWYTDLTIDGQQIKSFYRRINWPYEDVLIHNESATPLNYVITKGDTTHIYQAFANKYPRKKSLLEDPTKPIWIEESMTEPSAQNSKYYFAPLSQGMYVCLDKKLLTMYIGNATLKRQGYDHWEGDNYDWTEYLYCLCDVLFLFSPSFIRIKNKLLNILQSDFIEDKRYIVGYILREQWEKLITESPFFADLQFRHGTDFSSEKPTNGGHLTVE